MVPIMKLYDELHTLCRVCLTKGKFATNILTGKCSNELVHSDVLMECASITITKNEILPYKICGACVSQLESYAVCNKIDEDFVATFIESDRVLNNLVSTGNIYNMYIKAKSDSKLDSDVLVCICYEEDCTAGDSKPDVHRNQRLYVQNNSINIELEEIEIKTEPDDDYFQLCTTKNQKDDVYFQLCTTSVADNNFTSVESNTISVRDCTEKPYGEASGKHRQQSVRTLTHNPNKPYKCTECNKSYFQEFSLRTHAFTHRSKKPHGNAVSVRAQAATKEYKCGLCCKTSTSRKHVCERMFNRSKCIYVSGEDKSYECDACGAILYSAAELMRHVDTHVQRAYKCDTCDVVFAEQTLLERHRRTRHMRGELKEALKKGRNGNHETDFLFRNPRNINEGLFCELNK